jgi:hypothetical protein
MAFRGYFTLNGAEMANSSRIVAHMSMVTPTSDFGIFESDDQDFLSPGLELFPGADVFTQLAGCSLTPWSGAEDGNLFEVPDTAEFLSEGLYLPPNGSRRYDKGLIEIDGPCWGPSSLCFGAGCRAHIGYNDSWPGLQALIGDLSPYRVELAPWYTTRIPESAEFAGIWMLDVQGLGPANIQRTVTEMVGSGGTAAVYRDTSRVITFDALLIACSNAGLEYGLEWLTCLLRTTNNSTDAVLQFLTAHPGGSQAVPATLMRQAHQVVYTGAPTIKNQFLGGGEENQQANTYRIGWSMTALHPYLYLPPININIEWDEITTEQIQWVHATDCVVPINCTPMPILFSADCVPETVQVVTSPPPSCGGCMPVCAVQHYLYTVPTFEYPIDCRETAVNMTITNTANSPTGTLSLQGYWQQCGANPGCQSNLFPVQIAGLPPNASIVLDSIAGRYYAVYDDVVRRPVGIVSTPNGAPWQPTIIDRTLCWQFVVIAADDAEFSISMSMSDRDA